MFYDCIYTAIELTVPLSSGIGRKFPEWYSDELKKNILLKKQLHKEWKNTNAMEIYVKFKKIRALCIKLMRESHKKHKDHIDGSHEKKHFLK